MRVIWIVAAVFIILGSIGLAAGQFSGEYAPGTVQRAVDFPGPTTPG